MISFFSGYKQRTKIGLTYLERKLQQDTYGSCIFKLKCHKTEDKSYLQARKQQPRYRWIKKGNNCVFDVLEETSKVHCMDLPFKNLIISSKNYQQYEEVKMKQYKVRLWFFEVKIQHHRWPWWNYNLSYKNLPK